MRLELGAFAPQPGGTGHFLDEGGIEAAARRGLERKKREAAAREKEGASSNDLEPSTKEAVSHDKEDARSPSVGSEEGKELPKSQNRKHRSPWQVIKHKFSTRKEQKS